MFRIAINKLLRWFFSRVLASHEGGPGSIPGRDMSVLGPLFRMEITVKSLHNTTNKFILAAHCWTYCRVEGGCLTWQGTMERQWMAWHCENTYGSFFPENRSLVSPPYLPTVVHTKSLSCLTWTAMGFWYYTPAEDIGTHQTGLWEILNSFFATEQRVPTPVTTSPQSQMWPFLLEKANIEKVLGMIPTSSVKTRGSERKQNRC